MAAICRLCTSPYRKEVIHAYKTGIKIPVIYEKYQGLMKFRGTQSSFYQMVRRHLQYKHNVTAILVPEELKKPANLESLVTKLNELAMLKVENMEPNEVKLNEVFRGNQVLLQSKQLQLTEDAMTIALTKMFGPTIMGEEITEGEIANELPEPRSAENGTAEQENPQ
jgi:hypothetical protein